MNCGAPTLSGGRCRYRLEECPHEQHRAARPRPAPAQPDGTERDSGPALEAIAQRDLRAVAWWVAGAIVTGGLKSSEAGAMATLIRTLHALGPEPRDEDEVLREVELRGVIMNGCPPRDAEEWELAEKVFGPAGVAEFRKWEAAGRRM